MGAKKFFKNLILVLVAAALLVCFCYLALSSGSAAAEAGTYDKYNSLVGVAPVPDFHRVEATWTVPGHGSVGDISWKQTKVGDDMYLITGLYNHDLIIDFKIGFIEYRGAHMLLDRLQDYMAAGIGWREAVANRAHFSVLYFDHSEDFENDRAFKEEVWMRVPSAASYWRWRRGEGSLKLLGQPGSY